MSVHPDITACSRHMLQRLLDGRATSDDRAALQGAVETTIRHNPLECPQCVHEAATAVPPLIMISRDVFTGSLYVTLDEGPAQGQRAGDLLRGYFESYPQAREYARAISGAVGKVGADNLLPALVAFSGAIHHLITKACEGTL